VLGRLGLAKAAGAESKEISVVVCIDRERSRKGKLKMRKQCWTSWLVLKPMRREL
jgi:hypothetical protein